MTCLQEQNRGVPQVGAHLMVQPLASFPSGAPGPFPSRPHPRQDTDTLCFSGYRATSKGICNSDHAPEKQAHEFPNFCFPQRDPWPACSGPPSHPPPPPLPCLLYTELLQKSPTGRSEDTTSSPPRSFWSSIPTPSSPLQAFPPLYPSP